jgi:hypothetical protein
VCHEKPLLRSAKKERQTTQEKIHLIVLLPLLEICPYLAFDFVYEIRLSSIARAYYFLLDSLDSLQSLSGQTQDSELGGPQEGIPGCPGEEWTGTKQLTLPQQRTRMAYC